LTCKGTLLQVFIRREIITVRGQSYVLQNIDPPPPSPPGECVLPPNKGRGYNYTLAGPRWGWGVNILEDERHRIALLQ
jgi:hypothetical protein